jgi:hypothetical protein
VRGRCEECGFDADSVSPSDAVVALRSLSRRWRAATALADREDDDVLRRRPSPEVWSVLEYAAHTRDAIAVNGWAMGRTLDEDHPVFEWPGEDVREKAAAGYSSLAPEAVVDELAANAGRAAERAERVDAGDWRRTASIPDAHGDVDALWFLHHAVHEGTHHLRDVERVLRDVRARS